MLAAFLNPFTIIAGSALVLTPIVIHLINRMRFRRVQWAAMEFLLKAQKRMRRRKILEQLLLLLLRCLLVFLVGALFARYIGGCGSGPQETRPTTHVVVLDDTPSMAESSRREDGMPTTAFDEAKRLVYERLMPAAAEATTGQTLHLVRLSDLDSPFPFGTKAVDGKEVPRSADEIREAARVQGKSIAAMGDYLRPLQPAVVRKSVLDGIKKARKLFDERTGANNAQVLHIISDLRASDWAADGAAIYAQLKELKDEGVAVHLIDVANPARKPDRKAPDFGDNVSILEFAPRNRVVSVNQQTEVELRVRNNGKTDLKDVAVSFYLNGQGNVITSAQIPSIPANQVETLVVKLTLTQTGTKEKPLDRFNLITAVIQEASGLAIDNARHTIVEVRDTLKVLVVDGRTVENGVDLREKPEGDSYYLRTLLQTKAQELGNLEVTSAEFGKLDKIDLRPFSTIYLMNVPTLSEAAAANVERFVREGGGVGFFLGPDVKPDEYNARLYKGSTSFFPVQLQSAPSPELTLEQKLARELAFGSRRILLRDRNNRTEPALKGIYTNDRGELVKDDGVEKFFLFPNIDVHWPVRRSEWRDDPRVKELYCLTNEATNGTFDQRAETLKDEIKKRWNEPKFEAARKYLGPLIDKMRSSIASSEPLSILARYLDQMLCDQTNDGHESEPVLREFWNQPEMAETRKLATELRDAVKYGDPLYVVKQYYGGRVAVMTTDAGGTYTGKKQWSDWASGKGSAGWVPVVGEMQKYLSGGGDATNRAVGSEFVADFDATRYEPTVSVSLLTTSDPTKPSTERKLALERKDLGKLPMGGGTNPTGAAPDAPPLPFKLQYADTKAPGAYLFTLTRKKAEGPIGAPDPLGTFDFVGAAFNVDAINEGDLRRANTDDIAAQTNKAPLHNAEDLAWIDDLKQKPSDLSSGRWLYLLILLVLVAEQAWAVRLSYHSRPEDLEALAPSAAAAYAQHTPVSAAAGEPAP